MATFGNTVIGSSSGIPRPGGTAVACRFLLPDDGDLSSISTYISSRGLPNYEEFIDAVCGIYSDIGGVPSVFMGATAVVTGIGITPSWIDFPFTMPLSLAQGYYWLVIIVKRGVEIEAAYYVYEQEGSVGQTYYVTSEIGWPTFPPSLVPTEIRDIEKSIYATYIPLIPPPQHVLTIDSMPITGIPFTIGGIEQTTPYAATLDEGVYLVEMPLTLTVGANIYNFVNWNDGDTSPSKTIDLLVDIGLIANYELYTPPEYVLSVSSIPINGITFILRGVNGEMSYVTPWMGNLEEGTYEVEMPSNVLVDSDVYNFVQWEDSSTNPIRIVTLVSDLALVATYQLQIVTALEVHAFVDSNEVVADGIILETGLSFQTPITIEVEPGRYNVQLTYGKVTKTYTTDVTEGSTIRVDGQLAMPTPSLLPMLVLAIPVVIVIVKKLMKK